MKVTEQKLKTLRAEKKFYLRENGSCPKKLDEEIGYHLEVIRLLRFKSASK